MNAYAELKATAAKYGYDLRRTPAFDAGHMNAHEARVLTQAIIEEAALNAARSGATEPLATDAQVSEYMELRAELIRNGDKTFFELGIDDAELLTATAIAAHIATARGILTPAVAEPTAEEIVKAAVLKMNLFQLRAVAAEFDCDFSAARAAILSGEIPLVDAQKIIANM